MNWIAVTNLGDAALMLPVAAAATLWLFVVGAPALALRWLLALAVAIGAVAATKLAFLGWGVGIAALDFTGISGHSALATTIQPVAAGLLAGALAPRARPAAMLIGYGLGVAVAVSRVILHFHSPAEIIAGCAVGGVVSLSLVRSIARMPRIPVRAVSALAATLLVIVLCADGDRAPSERLLTRVALVLSGADHPHSRDEWKEPPARAAATDGTNPG